MTPRPRRRLRLPRLDPSPTSVVAVVAVAAAALLAAGASAPVVASAPAGVAGPGEDAPPACVGPAATGAGLSAAGAAAVDPERIEMASTRQAGGGSGVLTLRLSSSAFGVALAEDGSYRHHVEVSVEELPPVPGGTYVVWAATPDLDRHEKLGAVGASGSVSGEVAWNKFLVFVTAEASADVEAWSQSIVLSARSPSGRMHTMAGHGPFSGEPCLDPRP